MTTTADTATNAANTAAEAIRTLNHATLCTNELIIGDLYRILGDLAAMAHRLPQTCDQLTRILSRQQHQLEHDDGRPSHDTIARVTSRLGDATAAAITIAHDLDQAHQSITSLRAVADD